MSDLEKSRELRSLSKAPSPGELETSLLKEMKENSYSWGKCLL